MNFSAQPMNTQSSSCSGLKPDVNERVDGAARLASLPPDEDRSELSWKFHYLCQKAVRPSV